MEWLGSLLDGGLLGGLFGALGGAFNSWIKYKADKDDREFKRQEGKDKREHERLMIVAETDATIKEIEANVKRDTIITEGKIDALEVQGRSEIMRNYDKDAVDQDTLMWMMKNKNPWTAWVTVPLGVVLIAVDKVVDFLRKMVRPVTTYASVSFSFFVLYYSFNQLEKMGIALSPDQWVIIFSDQLRLISFISSTAVSFWFSDRWANKQLQERLSK